jgi:hypothetical protein
VEIVADEALVVEQEFVERPDPRERIRIDLGRRVEVAALALMTRAAASRPSRSSWLRYGAGSSLG